MSYPVSGACKGIGRRATPWITPLVPHGISRSFLTAPRSSASPRPANPRRHLEAAEALGADVAHRRADDAGEILADRITWFMQRLKVPNGSGPIGYTIANIPARGRDAPQPSGDEALATAAGPEELAACLSARCRVVGDGLRAPGTVTNGRRLVSRPAVRAPPRGLPDLLGDAGV